MGNIIPKVILRLFDYPIKRRPICFLRQDEFSSTGEPLPKPEPVPQDQISEYDKLVQGFYTRVLEQRRAHLDETERNEMVEGKVPTKFAGWDELTISNLHSLFILFDNNLNGRLNYDDFTAILESLGDTSSNDYRKLKFEEIDRDLDGFITYEDYLHIIYNFNDQDGENLKGLAKLCFEIAANIKFMRTLSIGEQLEYGLF